MKYIINFFSKRFSQELPKPIGRWNIEYCNKKIDTKIDLSNEDHCGPCGQYAKTKIDLQNKTLTNNNNSEKNVDKEKK
jgi:hypothetical protein